MYMYTVLLKVQVLDVPPSTSRILIITCTFEVHNYLVKQLIIYFKYIVVLIPSHAQDLNFYSANDNDNK